MRYSEIITEAKSKGVWLYHGTQLANLQSLKKHGLDSKFSKVRAGLIHLSSNPNQAAGYFNNFGIDGPGILLRVNSSALDQTKLGPDREDLMDILDQRRSRKEWYECDWKQSLRMCGQCTYDGVIPVSLLTVEDCEIDDERVVVPVPLVDFDIARHKAP